MKNSKTSSETQLWEAFQYVSGDLTVEESEQFELRMADDADLCDAVAEATLLTLSVAELPAGSESISLQAAATQEQVPQQSRSAHRAIATIVSLTCCLALGVFLLRSPSAPSPASSTEATVADQTTDNAEDLVNAWADSFADEESETEVAVADELEVPDWMFAAMTLPELEDEHSDMPINELMPDDMEL